MEHMSTNEKDKGTGSRVSGSKLSFHGVERVLERSNLAPAWLDEILQGGQFAHLLEERFTKNRHVLVFDVLASSYIVPVLAPGSATVITILTLKQHENTYGPVPPIMLQLAQAARTKAVAVPEPKGPTEAQKLAMQQTRSWRRRWYIVLLLKTKPRRKLRITPDVTWRQLCVTQEFDRHPERHGGASKPAELPFEAQARLLGKSPDFLEWVVRSIEWHGEDISTLECVEVGNHVTNKMVDLTSALFSQAKKANSRPPAN